MVSGGSNKIVALRVPMGFVDGEGGWLLLVSYWTKKNRRKSNLQKKIFRKDYNKKYKRKMWLKNSI